MGISLISCTDEHPDTNSGTHIKYFGFAITDCEVDYSDQVKGFVNLVDICPLDLSDMSSKILKHTSDNNEVLIHLQGLFTQLIPDSTSPSMFRYQVLEDWKLIFNTWVENNKELDNNTVAAFTIVDEPAWNQLPMDTLHLLARKVKQSFPDIPIMVIEAPDVIDQLEISDDIDWIGFDRYGTLLPDQDPEYLRRWNLLRSKKTRTDQNMVVIMESQWLDLYSDLGFDQSVLIPMVESYYQMAIDNDDVVAVISYLLPSGFDATDQKGFIDLNSDVKELIKEKGRLIIEK